MPKETLTRRQFLSLITITPAASFAAGYAWSLYRDYWEYEQLAPDACSPPNVQTNKSECVDSGNFSDLMIPEFQNAVSHSQISDESKQILLDTFQTVSNHSNNPQELSIFIYKGRKKHEIPLLVPVLGGLGYDLMIPHNNGSVGDLISISHEALHFGFNERSINFGYNQEAVVDYYSELVGVAICQSKGLDLDRIDSNQADNPFSEYMQSLHVVQYLDSAGLGPKTSDIYPYLFDLGLRNQRLDRVREHREIILSNIEMINQEMQKSSPNQDYINSLNSENKNIQNSIMSYLEVIDELNNHWQSKNWTENESKALNFISQQYLIPSFFNYSKSMLFKHAFFNDLISLKFAPYAFKEAMLAKHAVSSF